tara:strand:+ start:1002 stop:2627 length:1626 start_codon:yes stop_codon:yes gene_type:complete
LVFCFYFYYSSSSLGDTSPTTTQDLTTGTLASPVGGCPPGTTPATINSSSQVRWGECVNIYAISFAINQALTQAGISVDKAHYSWRYIHCFNTPGNFCNANISNRVNTTTGEITDDTYWDELTVVVTITDDEGNIKQTKTWTMDKWYNYAADNPHSTNEIKIGSTRWQVHEDFIELYDHTTKTGTIYTPNDLGSMSFTITGQDKGQWDGYYGPIVNTLQTYFTYRTNPCTGNALYDPSCPGYAEAFAQQQYEQNCSANPLYDSGCPGYATAFYNQQCTINPLYDAGCPGYEQAFLTQQCKLDATYDASCDGYFEAKCEEDALFDRLCTGYNVAYFNQQCLLNPQYDEQCTGYVAPIDVTDPIAIDDGTGTGDSIVDDVLDVPELPTIEIVETPVVVEPKPEPEPEVIEEIVVEETIEEEIQQVVEVEKKTVKKKITKKEKAMAKKKKLKQIAQKRAKSLAEKMSDAASFEVQQQVQQQLISMLSFVPDFSKYSKAQLDGGQLPKEVNLKGGRIVDHQFARWFVNDPNYDKLEELQYNLKGN